MSLPVELLLAADLQVQMLKVTREQMGKPLLVQVGAGRVSRLVFPEASTGSKYSPRTKEAHRRQRTGAVVASQRLA